MLNSAVFKGNVLISCKSRNIAKYLGNDNGFEMSGYYNIQWNASQYSSGVYFIEMVSTDFKEVRKIIYMK